MMMLAYWLMQGNALSLEYWKYDDRTSASV